MPVVSAHGSRRARCTLQELRGCTPALPLLPSNGEKDTVFLVRHRGSMALQVDVVAAGDDHVPAEVRDPGTRVVGDLRVLDRDVALSSTAIPSPNVPSLRAAVSRTVVASIPASAPEMLTPTSWFSSTRQAWTLAVAGAGAIVSGSSWMWMLAPEHPLRTGQGGATAVASIVASEPWTNTPTSRFCSTRQALTVTFARAFVPGSSWMATPRPSVPSALGKVWSGPPWPRSSRPSPQRTRLALGSAR